MTILKPLLLLLYVLYENHPLVTMVCVNQVKPWIKTSLAPGSGVVKKYLDKR